MQQLKLALYRVRLTSISDFTLVNKFAQSNKLLEFLKCLSNTYKYTFYTFVEFDKKINGLICKVVPNEV